jgi:hypothetical protein
MTWLTPLAGAILAAVVLPPLILLYFLKLRRKTQPIGSTLLWQRAVEDLRANAPFQRLRMSILLFLQLLVLALLVLSIMQPQIQAGARAGGKVVFLIDNSASMTARDGNDSGATRLDEAKRLAREQIERAYAGGWFSAPPGETMVIEFNEHAQIHCRFTDSKSEILAAIDRIQPTHAATRLEEALKLARAYTVSPVDPATGEPRAVGELPVIELFSDGRIADQRDQVKREIMIYHPVGSEDPENVGIASLAIDRPYDQPNMVEVFASLVNFAFKEVACDIELSVDGNVLRIEPVRLSPAELDPSNGRMIPGRANVVFTPFEQPRGAVIQVRNLRPDALEADNAARIVVPPPKQLRVAVVGAKSFVLRSAREGMPLRHLQDLSEAEFVSMAEDGGTDQFDVIILDNVRLQALPPGRYLSFGAAPPLEGINPYGEGDAQLVLTKRDEHPALRFVMLDNLVISKSSLIQPAEEVRVLVEGSGGPLMVEVARGPQHAIHVTFDPLDSNWPFLHSFVTFVFNAVEYLGHSGESLASEGLAPGQSITARLPAAATDIKLLTPASTIAQTIASPDSTSLAWGPARLAGLYLLTWNAPEPQSRAYAVNLFSEEERDIKPLRDITIGRDSVEGQGSGDSAYTALWPWALGLCLAVLMLEWWIYHRKTHI